MRSKGLTSADIAVRRNVAGGVFSVFAAAAVIVQVLSGPLWLRVMFAAVALIGACLALVLLLEERTAYGAERQTQQRLADRLRSSVELALARDDQETSLIAMNGGLHVVRDMEIWALALDEDWRPETHGSLPRVLGGPSPGVDLNLDIAGGWFSAKIAQLNPGAGLTLMRYEEADGDYQRVGIDVRWNDHEGLQRTAVVSADLRECTSAFCPLDVRPLDAA